MNKKLYSFLLFLILSAIGRAQSPALPKPTPSQLAWHDMEFYLFTHFGPNTFTNKEWGHGDEPEDIFNPSQLDCNQWALIAKQSGAKGIIITAKHHDGFCLWPSAYSTHTVRESKWKNGKGDVLKDLAAACKKYGLKFGVYISPWDRNHPDYGTAKYNDVYVNTMKEIFKRYSPIWELWWDGANGEGPGGKKQIYDFPRFEAEVRKLSPETVVFSDIGPDIRWIGNERGIVGDPNWNFLDTVGFKRGLGAPVEDTLNHGNYMGRHWIPGECDVSIRPGWFYHQEENDRVKSGDQLFRIYLQSVGRGANLLLNVPPDNRGRIHANDSTALMRFKDIRTESFKLNLLEGAAVDLNAGMEPGPSKSLSYAAYIKTSASRPFTTNQIKIDAKKIISTNCIILQEDLRMGQGIRAFTVELYKDNALMHRIDGTSMGHKRILTFPLQSIDHIKINITQSSSPPQVKSIAAFHIADERIENQDKK